MQRKDMSNEIQEIEDIHYVIAKYQNNMKAELSDPLLKIVNTNKVEETYQTLPL